MADIKHKLVIGSSLTTVYKNITTQNGLAGWWTPDTSAKEEVGAVLRFGFGPTYFKEMKVISLTPDTKVEWKCITGTEEWLGTNIQFMLEEEAGKAVVYFSHNDWESQTPMFSQCSYDWAMFLRSLKQLCEKGKGSPYPNQHQ